MNIKSLATYQKTIEQINANWIPFQKKRQDRLKQRERNGRAAEKVTEGILEDLLTLPLDWSVSDINYQIHYADMLVTELGIGKLLIEAKNPEKRLLWNKNALNKALDQAYKYATEQKVNCIGISDGHMLYVANIESGGLTDRVNISLSGNNPPEALFWISKNGIYRPVPKEERPVALPLADDGERTNEGTTFILTGNTLIHPKYKRPASCFAYVGNPNKTSTWKLPYLENEIGAIDLKRLPKAIQSVLTNYRGGKVSSIPEQAIPDVLVRLGLAVEKIGKMPFQDANTADVYKQLENVLIQIDRIQDVKQ